VPELVASVKSRQKLVQLKQYVPRTEGSQPRSQTTASVSIGHPERNKETSIASLNKHSAGVTRSFVSYDGQLAAVLRMERVRYFHGRRVAGIMRRRLCSCGERGQR
jgi:hypothetical protein